MNKQAILEKQAQVDLVTETMRTTKSLTIIEYRGLTVAKLEKLRRDLRKEGAEIKVF
jgi:large subunit ribosomal protein L10